ncbi:MAG: APC family permease [Anaerolineae bacterium]|nr:APC family permease [Anaerolineae bacterium]
MLQKIKSLFLGPPLPTRALTHERLSKMQALAAFSPDALSSIAYANQEIYLGLVIAGSAGLALSFPIGLTITGLLLIVALSYLQTIQAYPSGGGSYAVARDNLGTLPGLVAAAALLVGYLLTAAVSLTAGVEAIASAFPALWPYRVGIALALLGIITLLNLRGLRETGNLMAIPVYLFLFTYFFMLAYGVVRAALEGPTALVEVAPPPLAAVTLPLILHAFSAGCTALTGIEAISNGVPAFQAPETNNARRTLLVMAGLMGALFVGSLGLIQFMGVVAGPEETILSALARRVLGPGVAYFVVQGTTMLILAVATNTSFAGFPRLAALLAADGFIPRQLSGLGDRLVFANGIILLSLATGVLIVLFGGDSHALIPLFAVGVFLAFTLSQAGMIVYWYKERGRGWWVKAALNALGALATASTVVIVGFSRFLEGAWITLLVIPLLVVVFLHIRSHYQDVAAQLSLGCSPTPCPPPAPPRVVIPVSGVHRGMVDAVNYARSISNDVTAVYVQLDPGNTSITEKWQCWWPDIPLVILASPYRSLVGPLLEFLDETDAQHADGQMATVVLPEFVPAKWWHSVLHNQTALLLKAALLYRRRNRGYQQAIIDVPYHLQR